MHKYIGYEARNATTSTNHPIKHRQVLDMWPVVSYCFMHQLFVAFHKRIRNAFRGLIFLTRRVPILQSGKARVQ